MIQDLRPYPLTIDSGAPWLGRVPEHWELKRLKTMVAQINQQTADMKRGDVYVALEHVESWTGRMRPSKGDISFESTVKRFKCDDVLFGKLRPYLAKVIRMPTNGVCVGEFLVLRPRSSHVHSAFLEKMLRSAPIIDVVNSSTFGAKMPRADWGFIGNLLVTYPSPDEQIAIVRFLNHEERQIWRYVMAKQKTIRLLEEQKQFIIQEAVIRGLDPSVRLKPSPVPWLGDMPDHWEIRRNGRLFAQRNETGFAALPILEVSLRTGVRLREFSSSARKQVMSDRSKYKRALKGDIAYNMMRMWQGAVGVVPADGLVSPAYIVARPFDGVDVRYFNCLFRTAAYKAEIDAQSRGIVKDRNRLYWEDFKQMSSPYPPREEQARIADHIDDSTRAVNAAMEQADREIALLREYRARLIADVVTGKLDVRARAAELTGDEDAAEAAEQQVFWDEEREDTSAEHAEEALDEVTHA